MVRIDKLADLLGRRRRLTGFKLVDTHVRSETYFFSYFARLFSAVWLPAFCGRDSNRQCHVTMPT